MIAHAKGHGPDQGPNPRAAHRRVDLYYGLPAGPAGGPSSISTMASRSCDPQLGFSNVGPVHRYRSFFLPLVTNILEDEFSGIQAVGSTQLLV